MNSLSIFFFWQFWILKPSIECFIHILIPEKYLFFSNKILMRASSIYIFFSPFSNIHANNLIFCILTFHVKLPVRTWSSYINSYQFRLNQLLCMLQKKSTRANFFPSDKHFEGLLVLLITVCYFLCILNNLQTINLKILS